MATSSDISVGLAHELVITACKAGFTVNDLTAMAHGEELLRQILSVVHGRSRLILDPHIIDCDAAPCIPHCGWEVEEHKKGGRLTWDPSQVTLLMPLHFTQGGGSIEGHDLRERLESRKVANATILDDLLRRPYYVPQSWRTDQIGCTRSVYFFGTIYRHPAGKGGRDHRYVRGLRFRKGGWQEVQKILDDSWFASDLVLLLES